MPKIQPAQEVLSLFGMVTKSHQTRPEKSGQRDLIISFARAFFIILAVSLFLGLSSRILVVFSQTKTNSAVTEEKTAFIPGQFVSAELSRGYLGKQ